MVDATLVFATLAIFGQNTGNLYEFLRFMLEILVEYCNIQKSKNIQNVSCWRCFTAGMSFWRPPSVRNPSASRGGWSAAIPDARWMTWKRCGKRWGRLDFRHLGKENGCFVGLFASLDVHNVPMGDIASNWFRLISVENHSAPGAGSGAVGSCCPFAVH